MKQNRQKARRAKAPPPASPAPPAVWLIGLRRYAGPVALTLGFAALTWGSWRKWPDLLIDFGHELYVPWQLSTGKVLYRDIAFLYGPLSQYLNALWFTLFGVSLTTLIFCNLTLLAALTALLYLMLARACDRLTATAACALWLGVFAFGQYSITGNYNFVCPYSHEATHGTLLAVAMLYCLSRHARHPSPGACALAGLCFGLVLLTRAEVSVAAAVAALVAVGLLVWLRDAGIGRGYSTVLSFVGAALLPSLAAFGLFLCRMAPIAALHATGGAWMPLLTSAVAQNAFFVTHMGLDEPGANLLAMLRALVWLLVVMGGMVLGDLGSRRLWKGGPVPAAIIGVLVLAVILANPDWIAWREVARTLPVVTLLGGVGLLVVIRRRGRDPLVVEWVPLFAWATYALILLGKISLSVRVSHYGFYLAMPAALTLVGILVWGIPQLLHRRHGGGVFRNVALALIAGAIVYYVQWSQRLYQAKDFVVGEGGDAILDYSPSVDPRGQAVAQALQRLRARLPANGTFVALPEGVMLNYLARRANPTPYLTFMPTELTVFGETAMLEAFAAHPPDAIVLIHKDSTEFGVDYFGRDPRNGQRIMEWVNRRYDAIGVLLHEPLVDDEFGIKILQRHTDGR